MNVSRRIFLKSGGVAMIGMSTVPAFLQRAVAVQARLVRSGPAEKVELILTLTARDVGHEVPTGDLFRSLIIEAEQADDSGPGVPVVKVLTRRFRSAVHFDETGTPRLRRQQVRDERLLPGVPRTLVFPIALRPRSAMNWHVIHACNNAIAALSST